MNPVRVTASPVGDPQATARAAANRERLRATLRDFFRIDDPALIAHIEPELAFIDLAAGATLFREGDRSDDVYFVISGRLRALHAREDGSVGVVGDVARGETVGELALMTGDSRSATVVAVRNSVIVKMTRATFEGVMAQRPDVGFAVMRTVVDRFRRAAATRRHPSEPVVICLVPVSDGLDATAFARKLAGFREAHGGPVTVLGAADFAATFSRADRARVLDPEGPVTPWLDAAEAGSAALFLVADRRGDAWSERCLQQADEIVLLARAEAEPWPGMDAPAPAQAATATRTLVLLHAADTRSPTRTARWLAPTGMTRHLHVRPQREGDMRRLARILAGRSVGLVLSGGGARGFAHIGVMNALAEAGIAPDVIGGASIGSVMGAWRAMDLTGEALVAAGRAAFVDSGGPTSDYNFLPLVSLIKGGKTKAITEAAVREVAGADIDIEDTWITYYCVAANYSAASEAVLTRGPLAKSVLASYAIPGALPPIILGGHLHIDGGVVNNLPVDVMDRFMPRTVIAVDLMAEVERTVDLEWVPNAGALFADRLRPKARRRYALPTLPEILVNASFLQSLGRQREMRGRADLCFRPTLRRVGLLDWSRYPDVVQDGYESAMRQLEAIDPAILAACR
ncbi:MAG: patatin [Bradyrhizobiaceae bacterium]|nr:MAG: patatin [Bradyrhizobiaceae bacterium]